MRFWLRYCILLALLGAADLGAATNSFQWQMIALPSSAGFSHFDDLDNDGRCDLLAIDPGQNKLLIYRQRATGFTNAPDQVIDLPPHTAWITPFDVDSHPGLELLMSTSTGLVYFRENGGRFESEPRTLVKAAQVFTSADPPSLVSFAPDAPIPVISASEVILYRRNKAFEWSHGEAIPLESKRSIWFGSRSKGWNVGASPSRSLFIAQTFSPTNSDTHAEESGEDMRDPRKRRIDRLDQPDIDVKPENEAIGKLIKDIKKTSSARRQPGIKQVDLNGDGRPDLVLWQLGGELQFKTDIYVFLRGADGKLPEQPSQVLHCRGLPIPVDSPERVSPVGDLRGDGSYELILLDLKSRLTSLNSVLEAALSRGLEWELTTRSFNNGAFSHNAEPVLATRAILSGTVLEQWPIFICGDFNGDGRPDFVVQRSVTQWAVHFSTKDARGFTPEPAMTFETPMKGYFEIKDLNGDGLSDIILRGPDDPRVFIYLSQSQRAKGGTP
ncbi:MAG TPA: VCBS repeat-containing protein [Verrucomicrobiae bacterium]|nr:VCBS repeat-containing protein [Verrucomicrobiae bacterium]